MSLDLKNKQSWVPGAALLLSLLILIGSKVLFDVFFSTTPNIGVMVVEVLSFGVPALIVYRIRDSRFPINLRTQKRRAYYLQYMGLTFHLAMLVSLLSFLLNLIIYMILGNMEMTPTSVVSGSMMSSKFSILSFIAIVIIPPLVEEFFLRGVIFSAMENVAPTSVCIVLSGICFAMLHMNAFNMVGPFLAGCAYAYLSYSYDSIWPAVIAHGINNFYYYIVNNLISTYSSFGIWHYFTYINILLFLYALYFTLRVLGIQLYKKKLLVFNAKNIKLKDVLFDMVGNPAFFIFIVVFLLSVIIM